MTKRKTLSQREKNILYEALLLTIKEVNVKYFVNSQGLDETTKEVILNEQIDRAFLSNKLHDLGWGIGIKSASIIT